jgi:hypothetical protein
LVLVHLTEEARATSLFIRVGYKDPIKEHEPFCLGTPYR